MKDTDSIVGYAYLFHMLNSTDRPISNMLIVGNDEKITEKHLAEYTYVKRLDELIKDSCMLESKPAMFTTDAVKTILDDLLAEVVDEDRIVKSIFDDIKSIISKIKEAINKFRNEHNKKEVMC